MEKGLKISVFIPTWNRCEGLRLLLESLRAQTYTNFEAVIVDGGSSDGTEEMAREFEQDFPIIFFRQVKKGLIGAGNEALEKATGDIFTRTDDDVVVTPNWLEEIAATFASDDKIGGVTGPTIIPRDRLHGRDLTYFNQKMQESPNLFWKGFAKVYYGYFMEGQPFTVSRFFKSGAFSIGSNYEECLKIDKIIPADHLEACNSSIRRSLMERVGGYDPKYVGVGEYHEPDIAYKVKNLGYKLVFNPKAVLQHCPSISGVFKARAQAYGRSQNFILFYFRHIKPNTFDKLLRFSSYLLFINVYWFYKFVLTLDFDILKGIAGTVVGVFKYIPELNSRGLEEGVKK